MHSMAKTFFRNLRQPAGLVGRCVLSLMNIGHAPHSAWGRAHLSPARDAHILDIGCGGGANLAHFLRMCPEGMVCGIDFSTVSVAHSLRKNADAVAVGRCEVRLGNASAIPYGEDRFDVVTAFETLYFWPDLPQAFSEAYRVLKPGGLFLICNEATNPECRWTALIEDMQVYTEDTLRGLLAAAGFTDMDSDTGRRGNLCLRARKAPRGNGEEAAAQSGQSA